MTCEDNKYDISNMLLQRQMYPSDESVSSLAVEGFNLLDVPEYGLFVAADVRRCFRAFCLFQVMRGKEVHLFDKVRFSIYQVLDQLAGNKK